MKRGKPEKYIGLAEDIRQLINKKKLKKSDMLPSERKLAEIFSCSHLTIRKSLRLLEQENLIYKEPSRGNFVGSRPAMQRRTGLLGFMFPDDEIFYYKIFAELEKSFIDTGLHPVVHLTHNIPEKEVKIIDFLTKSGVDALIAVPNRQCVAKYRELKIPALFFDLHIKGLDIPYVVSDDYAGACQAVEYLVSLGHHRIAHIGGIYDKTCLKRLQGYRDILTKHSINIPENYVKSKEPTREWGYYAARELFAAGQEAPTAIFCGNDTTAAGAIRYFIANGINVPSDCSIIGFGNTATAEDLDLSSVSQHSGKIVQAISNNLQLILNDKIPPLETTISTSLIVRGSTIPLSV